MARRFELKTIPSGDDVVEDIDYKEILVLVLKTPSSERGIDYQEMSKRLKVMEKVKSSDGAVIFEEAEWKEVCSAFKSFRFARVLPGIVSMGTDIFDAPDVELKHDMING